jgi:nucleoside-diphosphate-sugar epimerase
VKDSPTILLTGFTGILGKRFAYRLAQQGYRVVCPIRAGSEQEARERFIKIFHGMKDLIQGFDESLAKNIVPVPGDVREKDLGMPEKTIVELNGPQIKAIWHLAALLDLTETKSQDVYKTNYLGTLNVLEFAKKQGIPELHYYSTFGSSGKLHEGIVREIPGIRPPAFRNTYERTKWEAERHVWQAQIRGEISATIYRPSIVVGDSVLGRYEQFNVFNHPFDVAARVRAKLCEKQGLDPKTATLKFDLRVLGDANATLNIVPIDWVIDTCMKLYSVPRSRGCVYHIVNPNPPSLGLTEKIFKENEPWEGVGFQLFDISAGFTSSFEKFINKQFEFLRPYILGEAIYDYSNVQAMLAFHGGIPPINNEAFLAAIAKRGKNHGWQEVGAEAFTKASNAGRDQLGEGFVWPEGSGLVVDFSPHHPVQKQKAQKTSDHYSITERILGKAYQFREKLFARRGEKRNGAESGNRDLVVLPFGMGVTRRGEAEGECYEHQPQLTAEVFSHMNQVVGFDLRAYARGPIPGHELLGDLHDNCSWAVSDDIVHLMKLFREIQSVGGSDFVKRLQVLPHSAGTYLAGWLIGVVSFQDMALISHQCSHLMSAGEEAMALEEINKWYFNQREKLSEAERNLLKQIRQKIDPALNMSKELLADKLHGRLELVFTLNSGYLEKLIADVRENKVGVSIAITMSPNTAVFAGNELAMTRFRQLFVGKRKIELRRVPLDVRGTPHFQRLKEAAKHATELLKMYDKQGRLRDPVIPMHTYNGQWIHTKEQYIQAVAGIADQTCYFDRMIERTLEEGGKHYLLIQSGMMSAAGDLFEGIIRNNASLRGFPRVEVYRPTVGTDNPFGIVKLLKTNESEKNPGAFSQPVLETIRWYEAQLRRFQGLPKEEKVKEEALLTK